MKRKIGLLMLSLIAAASAVCIPVREVRAEKVTSSVKDLLGYGEKEEFSIVPVNGGYASVSMNESGDVVGVGKTMRNTDQLWHIRKSGDYYYFESKKNKKVIELPEGAKANETVLTAAAYNGGDGQLWSLDRGGDGSFVISSKKNPELGIDANMALGNDAPGLTLSDGTSEIGERRFRFVPVSTREPVSEWGADIAAGSGKDFSEWTGCADYDWYYADKKASSYELTTADQLAGLAKLVNDGICSFSGRTIRLGRDIDLQNLEWKPIGKRGPAFYGIFDGDGHTVKGLCITAHNDESGLFGYVECGTVANLAVSGSVTGGSNTGGVVGCIYAGYIANVSGDVKVERAFGRAAGGICGRLEEKASIEHCTQYADVFSDGGQPDLGGIVGIAMGSVRCCTNRGDVKTASEDTGGIIGSRLYSSTLEYCVNYGEVSGTNCVGGIVGGETYPKNIIFGCLNSGSVTGSGKYCGGIAGEIYGDGKIYGCMNTGDVNGKTYAGGITGSGDCCCSFNTGRVESGSKAGAISGKGSGFSFCRALEGTGGVLCAEGKDTGAKWCTAKEAADGTCCFELNGAGEKPELDGFGPGWKYIFGQSIGMDDAPMLAGPEVIRDGDGNFGNGYHEVRVEYDRAYGKITGAGQYTDGRQVKLSAKPRAGYVFDHYEIRTSNTDSEGKPDGKNADQSAEIRTEKKATITIAKKIDRSYNVKAVFVPKTVKLDEGTPGEAEVGYLESDGTFNARETKMAPAEAWKYAQELAGGQADGENAKKAAIRLKGIWTIEDRLNLAGNKAVAVDLNGYTISRKMKTILPQDDGAVFYVSKNADLEVIDSNPDRKCHPVYKGGVIEGGRSSKSGGLFCVEGSLSMTGGTLYDGISLSDGGAIFADKASLTLDGTTIINCRSERGTGDNDGGAIIVKPGSTAKLKGCRISGCRSRMRGGAVYVSDGGDLLMEDTFVADCTSETSEGGAVYSNGGKVRITDSRINNCDASWGAGAIFRNKGNLYCRKTAFENNSAGGDGGAVHTASADQQTWLVGCSFTGNTSRGKGGAVYMDRDGLYMEDCRITGNASVSAGGGVFLNNGSADTGAGADIRGVMVIRNNDGAGARDNLVLTPNTNIFDQGLMEGSEVHLSSTIDGKKQLSSGGKGLINKRQAKYFFSDNERKIGVRDDKKDSVDFGLIASAFSTESGNVVTAGCAVILVMLGSAVFFMIKRRKRV